MNNTCSITYNLPKSMWKLIFNFVDAIFKFESPKRKTHKVHKNNVPCKTFKKYAFGIKKIEKQTHIAIHMNLWKYGQILIIQKTLIIKQLRFSKKMFLIWIYHFVLHYILNPNNKFEMWIDIKFSILWCYNLMINPYFLISKVHNY